ncbi:unnamed protein product [Adineta steineri]|uniref:Uncharacterized protein n=1 Tax=Adineta steineri TaxID=433720 RepID=A0A819DI52_9BILA|nr:unnamed protein product [Adineta steineri]CAF3837901.1 unnamed protein product [Adineta steineri]
MSSYFLLLLFIIMNNLSYVKLRTHRVMLTNMACINIPLANLSSRNDDKSIQLKIRSTYTVNAKSVNIITDNYGSILQAHPMLLIYLNDYRNENHASPAAYIFYFKLFTFLQYPILTFHYFHLFHSEVNINFE